MSPLRVDAFAGRHRVRYAAEMLKSIPQAALNTQETPYLMRQGQLFGHAYSAVNLYSMLAHQAACCTCLSLACE